MNDDLYMNILLTIYSIHKYGWHSLAAIAFWIDIACFAGVYFLYQKRHEPPIIWRGWRSISTRTGLMLLWLNSGAIADLLMESGSGGSYICPLHILNQIFFYSYISSVAVQCWHAYISWRSIEMLLVPANTRTTIAHPRGLLRYRRILVSPTVELFLWLLIAVFNGTATMADAIYANLDTIDPKGATVASRCVGPPNIVTPIAFTISALVLAALTANLRSMHDRFGLRREIRGISISLILASILMTIEHVFPTAISYYLYLTQILLLVGLNLIWSLLLPVHVAHNPDVFMNSNRSVAGAAVSRSHRVSNTVTSQPHTSTSTTSLTLSSTLLEVLRDDCGGSELLKQFCISEFSVENIMWVEASDSLKLKHHITPFDRLQSKSSTYTYPGNNALEFVKELHDLGKLFIRPDGVLTLNLPFRITDSAKEFINNDFAGCDHVPPDVVKRGIGLLYCIDAIVLDLMKDTFSRFRRTLQYQSFLQSNHWTVNMDPKGRVITTVASLPGN